MSLSETASPLEGAGLGEAMALATRAAQAMETRGDTAGALKAYRQAFAINPDDAVVSAEAGRLALLTGCYDFAETVLGRHAQSLSPAPSAIAGLALAQAMLHAFDRAQATLKEALQANPRQPLLWLALGEVLCLEGRPSQSLVFFEEAMRLDPLSPAAQGKLADALLLTDATATERALALSEAALVAAAAGEAPALTAAHARRLLAAGRLEEGWKAFSKALEPGDAALVEVKMAAPPWTPGGRLEGRLLLIGEEGLAETALLAQLVPEIIAGGVPLILSFDRRWQRLAVRSFPEATFAPLLNRQRSGKRQLAADVDGPLTHGGERVAAWASLRGLAPTRRARIADFSNAAPYLKPDGDLVESWKERLAALGPGPKVGVTWRASSAAAGQPWEVPPLSHLAAGLSAPDVHLIGLQEEAFAGEMDNLRDTFGLGMLEVPPSLYHGDLDELAALTAALDVVVGPPGEVTYLAAACGAETWFLTSPGHWSRLGEATLPWFQRARVISPSTADDWSDAMAELYAALEAMSSNAASSLAVNPASSR